MNESQNNNKSKSSTMKNTFIYHNLDQLIFTKRQSKPIPRLAAPEKIEKKKPKNTCSTNKQTKKDLSQSFQKHKEKINKIQNSQNDTYYLINEIIRKQVNNETNENDENGNNNKPRYTFSSDDELNEEFKKKKKLSFGRGKKKSHYHSLNKIFKNRKKDEKNPNYINTQELFTNKFYDIFNNGLPNGIFFFIYIDDKNEKNCNLMKKNDNFNNSKTEENNENLEKLEKKIKKDEIINENCKENGTIENNIYLNTNIIGNNTIGSNTNSKNYTNNDLEKNSSTGITNEMENTEKNLKNLEILESNCLKLLKNKEITDENTSKSEEKKETIIDKNNLIPENEKNEIILYDNFEKNVEDISNKMVIKDITEEESRNNLHKMVNGIEVVKNAYIEKKSYLNCDIRYFNFDFLVEKFGYFDIILMDPPWRIKGGQQNNSQFMFSNSKFSLDYNTMSNQEILNIRIDKVAKKGFIFLWILNTQMNIGYDLLNKWGYKIVDQIVWVKLKDGKINMTHGYYFMHSFEICLVGYKNKQGEHVEYISKVSNNIIFAEVTKKSQKPNELYDIIELMMPGSKKLEIFARNHNLRPGWFSLGNQLGELYEKWENLVVCNECNNNIKLKIKRCNKCGVEPIWGIRFACNTCTNFDLCEVCFDENLVNTFHDINHEWETFEVASISYGLPAHTEYNLRCNSCFQKPILGVKFFCTTCPNFNLCQNCFFLGELKHKQSHKIELLIYPVENIKKNDVKCSWCKIESIEGDYYKCEQCWSFIFCKKCYLKKNEWTTNVASTHKIYHKLLFSFIFRFLEIS